MVEVFKTDVRDAESATRLLAAIHKMFAGYKANFDLDDCDRILRIECDSGFVQTTLVIDVLKNFGFAAMVLSDNEYYDPFATLRTWV